MAKGSPLLLLTLLASICVFSTAHAISNPCAGQGKPIGRKGVVTGCICGGLIFEPNSTSNPCWKSKPAAPMALAPIVLDSVQTIAPSVEPIGPVLEVKPEEEVVVVTVAPEAAEAPEPKKTVKPKPAAALPKKPKIVPIVSEFKTPASTPAPVATVNATAQETPLQVELRDLAKHSSDLRAQFNREQDCPEKQLDYEHIKNQISELLRAGFHYKPSMTKPLIGKDSKWCSWNYQLNRVIEGLLTCKNANDCQAKCVSKKWVPGMTIDLKYLAKEGLFRQVGTSVCIPGLKSWRDEGGVLDSVTKFASGGKYRGGKTGDLSLYPIGNGVYLGAITYSSGPLADIEWLKRESEYFPIILQYAGLVFAQ